MGFRERTFKAAFLLVANSKGHYVVGRDMCCLCDEQEGIFTKQNEMKSYQAGSLMEMVHLDFPCLLSCTERGNEYILMVVDSFTLCASLLKRTA